MATPTLDQFLSEINRITLSKGSAQLSQYLVIEPPYAPSYTTIINELRTSYPKGADSDTALEKKIVKAVKVIDGGDDVEVASWSAFSRFMVLYFGFLRDVDVRNLLETFGLLSEVLQKANSALQNQTHGTTILDTVISYSRMFARLAMGLDKKPELIAHLTTATASSSDDSGPRETLPERAANIIRYAFVACLNDRSGSSPTGISADGTPQGKRKGIYVLANLCLKILFACRKTRGAAQISENIFVLSPPLGAYPKAQRCAYLYYLGRFLWANGHAWRAQKALQQAWVECHAQCLQQRRLILIFLISANMVCGRFPSEQMFARPEANGLRERFQPLCRYIAKGDLVGFRRHLDIGSEHYAWFSGFRLDLQLRNRCEVFVWRSICRKTFILYGDPGNPEARKAPTFDLKDVLAIFRWQETIYATPSGASQPDNYIDPDFVGVLDEPTGEDALDLPDMNNIHSKMTALIHQGLLGGYISFSRDKFAIQGAKLKGALAAGFPNAWKTVEARADDEVPGWKLETSGPAFGGGVVRLSGARPVGLS
ncbi:hypothetical protein E4T50_12834 [Aureobasidium sp. EXF-12298]|nr:hypothetical protein E4T50_12834 [Aureobasidium sp. EXF-12298]